MIRRIVNIIVEKFNTNNCVEIANKQGINIIEKEFDKKIKGLFLMFENERLIVINKKFKPIEKEIILAHELGHAFLHNGNFFELNSNDFFPSNTIEEVEANKFASELILHNIIFNEKKIEKLKSLSNKNKKKLLEYKLIDTDAHFYKLYKYIKEVE